MRNLFRFIIRYHFFLLFLLLETVALLLTVNHQQYQQTFFIHSANAVSGRMLGVYNAVNSYFELQRINEELLIENTMLRNQHRDNFLVTDRQILFAGDSIFNRGYTYQHARVINNSVNRRNNYLTINKGSVHGIRPDMGVITNQGVVGIVKDVSAQFSSVMSLLHSDVMISVRIKKNNHIGSLRWEGNDYRRAHMTYIPSHVELAVGDTIVTSGFSTVFPENIFIGTIQSWQIRRGEVFYTAELDLALDFNKLAHVYVVNHLFKEEQDDLESGQEAP